jgi:hypothetical protein
MIRDAFGVARLRVANGEQLPEGSSAVAFTPIGMSISSNGLIETLRADH